MVKQACYAGMLWFLGSVVFAEDFETRKLSNWHQWRGPLATGLAPEGDPPVEWSESKNIKWKVPIPGRGSASPIVWGDRIFVLTAIKTDRTAEAADRREAKVQLVAQRTKGARDGERQRRGPGGFGGGFGIEPPSNVYQFVVLCLDRNTGETVWQRTAREEVPHEGHHQTGTYASASPVTDGQHLYVSFGSRGIYCYDLDGNLQWETDLGDMQTRLSFGEGASPALHENTLVVPWDHEGQSFIAALDARTGQELWRQGRDEPSTWATPLVVDDGERTQVVASGTNRVRSYDLNSGQLLWECGGLGSNPIACPVRWNGLVIAMSGHRDPAAIAVPLSARGDVSDSDEIAWRIEGSTSYVSSPLLYGDTLYFTKSRSGILSAVDARTGEAIINQKRLPDTDSIYASVVGAAGRVYVSSREGVTNVLEHGPAFKVLATNELSETIDASPAIVGKEMFVRGEEHLYCISE